MPSHGNSKVKEIPYDRNGEMVLELKDVRPEDVTWKPNRIFYDSMKIEGRRRVGYHTSHSLALVSVTTGKRYRLMGDSVIRLLTNGLIIKGTTTGFWVGTKAGGEHYGIRWIEESKVPKSFVKKVEQQIAGRPTQQVWCSAGWSLRVEDGGVTVRPLTADGTDWPHIGLGTASYLRHHA